MNIGDIVPSPRMRKVDRYRQSNRNAIAITYAKSKARDEIIRRHREEYDELYDRYKTFMGFVSLRKKKEIS